MKLSPHTEKTTPQSWETWRTAGESGQYGNRPERRDAFRFPLKQELRHRGLGEHHVNCGIGETVNMSRRGLLFTTNENLRRGDHLEIFISWPAQLNQRIGLQLVARGRVVRAEPGIAAMTIHQHEFRTQLIKPSSGKA
ncbi:MAG TPA: PilZ domain-containing protein [Bryobacteraceae bacterium]|nr:PilZ domain-containing protein [Bryobacteraceae bacterium]